MITLIYWHQISFASINTPIRIHPTIISSITLVMTTTAMMPT
jgi:hypothetical protein